METCSAPNRFTGSIVAVAVLGTLKDGSISTVICAWLCSSAMVETRPTWTPRNTTAEPGSRPSPARGNIPLSLIVARKVAVGQPDERDRAEHQPEEDDQADDNAQEPLHPTNLAVALTPPKRISDMKRFTTTTRMMERRMARPAATPTPAGPPVAL